jgi:Tripartite tricarboxylate transporter family receptor
MRRRDFIAGLGSLAAWPLVARAQHAQAYPTRPVRFIIGYPPGGAADLTARLIGQWLSDRLGQPFIIESRPGASTNIATEAVVHAPLDGYTLLLVAPANTINATLYEKLNFQFHPRHRAGCGPYPLSERHAGKSIGSGQDRSRIHRLRQGQPGQTQHGVGWQWVYDPCVR